MNYMFMPLKRYADFSGRSRRLEFWLWWVFNMIVVVALCVIIGVAMFGSIADLAHRAAAGEFANYVPPEGGGGGYVELNGEKYAVPPEIMAQAIMGSLGIPAVLLGLWWLATFIPNLAVAVRRMHDQDKSGWWLLIAFVPFIGGIWLLILYLVGGTPSPNRFGPDPKGLGATIV